MAATHCSSDAIGTTSPPGSSPATAAAGVRSGLRGRVRGRPVDGAGAVGRCGCRRSRRPSRIPGFDVGEEVMGRVVTFAQLPARSDRRRRQTGGHHRRRRARDGRRAHSHRGWTALDRVAFRTARIATCSCLHGTVAISAGDSPGALPAAGICHAAGGSRIHHRERWRRRAQDREVFAPPPQPIRPAARRLSRPHRRRRARQGASRRAAGGKEAAHLSCRRPRRQDPSAAMR